MIDELRRMAIFATVAETGSFSAAAQKLRLSTSVVSHHISALEETLGITLLYRSTRAISLTDKGLKLLPAAQKMVAAASEGLDEISVEGDTLVGALRVTMPLFAAGSWVENCLFEFGRMHPNVAITLAQTDRQVDLIGEGFDLAVRLGHMPASDLRVRKIGVFERKIVCTPSYLANVGPIKKPQDLHRCEFVVMQSLPDSFRLHKAQHIFDITPENSRILVDSVTAARHAVLAGLGVQRLPMSEIADDLRDGRLVELLPEWSLPLLDINAVWPAAKQGSKLTARFLDHMLAVAKSKAH